MHVPVGRTPKSNGCPRIEPRQLAHAGEAKLAKTRSTWVFFSFVDRLKSGAMNGRTDSIVIIPKSLDKCKHYLQLTSSLRLGTLMSFLSLVATDLKKSSDVVELA